MELAQAAYGTALQYEGGIQGTLLKEQGIYQSQAPLLWCDNIGANYVSANLFFPVRTKHIEVEFHFVRERVPGKSLEFRFISLADQGADVFTKALARQDFQCL